MSAGPDPREPSPGVRLGDGDREQLADALARHHAAGRLTLAQLEERVAVVWGADTRDEAAATIADLPPLGPAQAPRRAWWRPRRHGESEAPGAGWLPTSERFRDPRSNRIMRVWVNPVDNSRHYVVDEER